MHISIAIECISNATDDLNCCRVAALSIDETKAKCLISIDLVLNLWPFHIIKGADMCKVL